ncbi:MULTISPECIES: Tex family protein [unclassified Leptolyngbya]|uniref:Tex family protein n=1 Tax=unclassified Leptolyngbya TaxID=2650499 RepID=UPI001681E181|nr:MULTISPECIES: Tex family protein [unclassified Leptolyngbya]MBD1909374.1 RNA-binding transcriptional accessory protein [Leptolyngbya sp. FACHB-8]MBD2157609.1 RNA-binding transcriptional accessory protein [Leptolyngbya sp. FACHB-16]
MQNLEQQLAQELSLRPAQIQNALELFAEGATVPFIARYRKERTGEMNEVQLRELADRYAYLTELGERKTTILQAIAEQGKLTDELKAKIEACTQKTELEDLYLPYRPKRRTRATIAREKGLEPLAAAIKAANRPNAPALSLEAEAAKFLSEQVKTAEEALKGAADILAEEVAEQAPYRAYLRQYLLESGVFMSQIKAAHPEGTTKFEMYRNYQAKVQAIAPHNLLALLRGETEDILTLTLSFDEEQVLYYLESEVIRTKTPAIKQFYREMLKDAFNRLMKTSLISAVMAEKKAWADGESIKTFEANLRDLLLAAPAGMKPTLALDPGFRTGCKTAVISETGKFLEYQTIFPHQSAAQREQAAKTVKTLIEKYQIQLIAIGNGTAGRETDAFVTEVLQGIERPPIKVMVNESGASIYSASSVALEEFPDLDLTVRGAISIGRRLQDPLAELVKIDPKSIGVGQYQHDVDQKLLKKKLDETVESCVNYVGVDLNTASKELLTFVSGLSPSVASNIVAYRNQNGAFRDRRHLLKVPKLGAKAFEQAAGFLRIRGGNNPLDNTAVHPESYGVVEAIARDLKVPLSDISKSLDQLKAVNLKQYVTDTIGEPTLRDIFRELEKPGRDPRAEFKYATFNEAVKEISDLQVGMQLEGIVTNVANFGAFVDIGVHQDGLIHVSQMADHFVSDPKQVVKVGQVVSVRVLEVNEGLKRISLSMKSSDSPPPNRGDRQSNPRPSSKGKAPAPESKPSSLEDLQAKFGRKRPK